MKEQLSLSHMNNANGYFGFGLDYQYREKYPFSGMDGLVSKYMNQLSHLSIVSIPSLSEAKKLKTKISGQIPFIHHLSGIAPANPHGPNLEALQIQEEISKELEAVWCLEDIGIWSIGPYSLPYFIPVLFDSQIADLVAKRINLIQANISIPFMAEIPACSFVIGSQTMGEFFHQLINETGCGMVLDVSHVFSYALAIDRDPFEILHSLPLDAAREIHIAGGRVNRTYTHRYIDSHSAPIMTQVYELLIESIRSCRNLRAITYEIGVHSSEELVENEILQLTKVLESASFNPKLLSNS